MIPHSVRMHDAGNTQVLVDVPCIFLRGGRCSLHETSVLEHLFFATICCWRLGLDCMYRVRGNVDLLPLLHIASFLDHNDEDE